MKRAASDVAEHFVDCDRRRIVRKDMQDRRQPVGLVTHGEARHQNSRIALSAMSRVDADGATFDDMRESGGHGPRRSAHDELHDGRLHLDGEAGLRREAIDGGERDPPV